MLYKCTLRFIYSVMKQYYKLRTEQIKFAKFGYPSNRVGIPKNSNIYVSEFNKNGLDSIPQTSR